MANTVGLDSTSNHTHTLDSSATLESLNLCSYNMHGFTQGLPFLQHMCDRPNPPDLVLIQESWLTCANLYKINNFSPKFSSFGKSAMEKSVGEGILRGRPFGGCHILVKSDLCKFISHVHCSDRFVILVYKNIVLLNVYLPTVVNMEDECRLVDLLTAIQDAIEIAMSTVRKPYLICGGDFNLNFDSNSRASILLNNFKKDWSLSLCNKILPGNINYSYYHESLQQRSLIDYFLIPDPCWLVSYKILDSALNLSDHLCIEICVKFHSYASSVSLNISNPAPPRNNLTVRDWSLQNRRLFYEQTRCNFIEIHDRILQLFLYCKEYNAASKPNVIAQVESLYAEIVSSLLAAASDVIPIIKPNVRKPWWDETLSLLKALSIETHDIWVDSGRPLQGPIFLEKQRSKLLYKKRIAENKKLSEDNISNSLQKRLLDSDQISFWKIWHKEFGKKPKVSNCVDGLSDDTCIANHFAATFANICKPSDQFKISALEAKIAFTEKLATYKGSPCNYNDICNIACIESAIGKLSSNKASGYDMLTAEYLKFCHPIVWSSLSMLFYVMLVYSYVPDAFGIGLTFPLLKADIKGSTACSDAYRGITIMPTISKLFELILLQILNPFIENSKSQFAFKKGFGCAHAIYSVNRIVNHFTSLKSTVNLCSVDISKAFDKVNHHKLFSKMMDRNVPINCISLLACWYEKSIISVRWGSSFSYFVSLETGVRQGSTLSPKLFALFVDEILVRLNQSGLGCHIKGMPFNAIMYADDLLLISISITDLQQMIDICTRVLDSCHLEINPNKTVGLRIGPRHQVKNCTVNVKGRPLVWKSDLKYLGIFIMGSKTFKCNLQSSRQKFFQAANGIFGKIGLRAPHNLILSLIDTFCIPVLLYGVEALSLTKSDRNTLDFTYSTTFFKIFNVKETATIRLCQFYSRCLPASYRLDIRKINLLYGIKNCTDSLPFILCSLLDFNDQIDLYNKYNISPQDSVSSRNRKVWSAFESDLRL